MFKNSKFFYGYASVFNEKDLNGDIILKESFKEEQLKPEDIPLLLEHNPRKKIGTITRLKQTEKGLFIEGFIERKFAKNKLPLSIGYIPSFKMKSENGIRFITNLKLFEVSVVNKPANSSAFAICVC